MINTLSQQINHLDQIFPRKYQTQKLVKLSHFETLPIKKKDKGKGR